MDGERLRPEASGAAAAAASAAADAARAAAERTARASYGRLVAALASSSGDLALAEDALAGAFETALVRWPQDGVPAHPEGWLLTVARNRQRDVWKSMAYRGLPLDPEADDAPAVDPIAELDPLRIPDRRLELLFVCAHPAIDPSVRTPLMLQAVLGFEAAQIAEAFAVPPATMAQRLVRAKRRIAQTRIPFQVPDRRGMPARVPALLEAVYGCAAITWRGDAGSMAGEAQYLAVTLAALLDEQRGTAAAVTSEAWGLASLVTLSLARRRVGEAFVPLEEQDPAEWDAALVDEGEQYLRRASAGGGTPGRFRLEAAIQAVHVDRRRTGRTDWPALGVLYEALDAVAPSLGAEVARSVVVARLDGPAAGLAILPEPDASTERFQPWWAARGEFLAAAGDREASREAFARAAALTTDAAVRAWLEARAAGE